MIVEMTLPASKQRIDSDSRFVQDEQFGLVEQGDSDRNAALLTAAEGLDFAVSRRKVEQFEIKINLRLGKLAR